MKKIAIVLLLTISSSAIFAQKEKDEKEPTSLKENLFTGGSVSLAFYNNTFLIGGSPVLGYSLTNWADAGIVVNYNYTSYRDYSGYQSNDRLRQTVYGGGAFVKLYPIRFLFAQAQVEHNIIKQKYIPIPGSGAAVQKQQINGNSFLIGGGYCTGREGKGGAPHFYVAVLFDVAKSINSPYTDGLGRTIPIVRGGIQIPLFQGKGGER